MLPIIEIENISKKYTINHTSKRYLSLRDSFVDSFNFKKKKNQEFWALDNVNFKINEGECVGIIGKNGAGKSTILKVLSKITPPTSGKIICRGRVASLLEVGTGFHPELSGRENIYLNGSILGLKRKEIDKQFDAIVDFSGVEQFISTPLKHYSSGMQLRLAFAVAAHLEPEILVIDEVLAVGDVEFQKKCIGKMTEVSKSGRTILFVSHNMAAVRSLCQYGVCFENGKAHEKMSINDAILLYSKLNEASSTINFPINKTDIIIHDFKLLQNNLTLAEYDGTSSIEVRIVFELPKQLTLFRIGFFLLDSLGNLINRSLLADWEASYETMPSGKYILSGAIPQAFLTTGNYTIQIHASIFGIKDFIVNELTSMAFNVMAPENFNPAHIGERSFGNVLIKNNWELTAI